MSVPIFKQGRLLVACIQDELDDPTLLGLRDELIERAGSEQVDGVLVDLSALDVLDSFATRLLHDLAQAIRLRGAETVLVGIRPEVALAMVHLGLQLDDVAVALDLQEGFALFASGGQPM